ncbi:MAG: putative toxin-antitoxin system toxin component, PIN family [Blastocatellia bacterium]
MNGGLRYVLDTNVIVSALLLPRSTPRDAFERALEKGKILVSLPALVELENVLSRSKFEKYLYEQERKQFMAALVREAEFIDVTERITECRDPRDDKFLELAVCGAADCLISGDLDLLALHPFRNIPILTPAEFLKQF